MIPGPARNLPRKPGRAPVQVRPAPVPHHDPAGDLRGRTHTYTMNALAADLMPARRPEFRPGRGVSRARDLAAATREATLELRILRRFAWLRG
jgi:hypothetical protein